MACKVYFQNALCEDGKSSPSLPLMCLHVACSQHKPLPHPFLPSCIQTFFPRTPVISLSFLRLPLCFLVTLSCSGQSLKRQIWAPPCPHPGSSSECGHLSVRSWWEAEGPLSWDSEEMLKKDYPQSRVRGMEVPRTRNIGQPLPPGEMALPELGESWSHRRGASPQQPLPRRTQPCLAGRWGQGSRRLRPATAKKGTENDSYR